MSVSKEELLSSNETESHMRLKKKVMKLFSTVKQRVEYECSNCDYEAPRK